MLTYYLNISTNCMKKTNCQSNKYFMIKSGIFPIETFPCMNFPVIAFSEKKLFATTTTRGKNFFFTLYHA